LKAAQSAQHLARGSLLFERFADFSVALLDFVEQVLSFLNRTGALEGWQCMPTTKQAYILSV
jgi:hypothetical protein